MTEPGTPYIGREPQDRQEPYSKSAKPSESRIVVLWKSRNALKTPGCTGPWERLLNTRTNGFQRNEGRMETHIAQGFLRLFLSETEADQIIRCAKKTGRYLIPLEVSKILRREIKKTLTDAEELRMDSTWLAFCKSTDADQRIGCTDPEVLEQWFDYVAKNYSEPLPEADPWQN